MNTILKIFDNIGFKFKIENNSFAQSQTLPSFGSLNNSHVGYSIPYLARNINANQWEVGVGKVEFDNKGFVVVSRHNVVRSSNNDSAVNFANNDKNEFYLFANQSNFDTGFSNTVIVDKSIVAYNMQAIYLVDSSQQNIDIILPNNPLENLVIEIKLVGGDNNVIIREHSGHIIYVLSQSQNYIKLTYKNQWYIVFDKQNNISMLSVDDDGNNIFTAMADPSGNPYSFQYNDGANGLLGSELYWSSGTSNKLLLGADSESLAHTIIPTSGSGSVIFNNDRQNADFLVYGSGNRNLFFTYDGRLGLNIPSGSRPTTIFHVINTICQEGFRLENRNVCHPANMTLYHKPNGSLSNNTQISQINLAAKNASGNKIDYAQIEAYSLSTQLSAEKGHIDLVVKSGSVDEKVFSANPDEVLVGYSGINSITINKDGHSTIGYSSSLIGINSTSIAASSTSLTFNGSTVSLQANSLTLGSGGSSVIAQGTANIGTLQSSNIIVPSIAPSSILAIGDSNQIVVASGVRTNNRNTISFSAIPSGKFLTTTENGAVTGLYDLDDYFYTDADILWNKFPKRPASICLKQITFDIPVPLEEFSVGDQLAIESSSGSTQYRFVREITIESDEITEILLDQNVTEVTVSNFQIYSITKGGYLSISRYVLPGTIGDNSDIILSLRPEKATEFNTKKKNIDFKVYGQEEEPALYVKANTNQQIARSGYYHLFATQDDNIFNMVVTSSGIGLNNEYSSANFKYDPAKNLFSGVLSDVGTNGKASYYGTYDQNGNVSEWIEKSDVIDMSDAEEMVAGGSVYTSGSVSPTGLRSIEFLARSGTYSYVGFRISASYGINDVANISASTGLNIDFSSVTDPGNISDTRPFYIKNNNSYTLTSIPDLGVVDNFYRIANNEITNAQYVKFLKAVATVDDRNLYSSLMYSENEGGIQQIVLGASDYDYATKANMDNKPVNYVSFISAIRFVNWLHNGAPWYVTESSVDQTIDSGAYDIVPNGSNTFIVRKNRYQKYWLPNLDQWHKAAYFEPKMSMAASGVPAVMVRRSEPYSVTSDETATLYASVSVSGWLYVDHLIVGDNPNASSPRPRRPIPDGDTGRPCTTNSDCLFCEVCAETGFCAQSTDACCVGDCCLTWDPASGTCTNCQGCAGSEGSDPYIPCPPFC